MNETLRTILDMDKRAQLEVEEAEQYRREAIAGLGAKKAAVIEDETRKAKESAIRRSERRKAEGEKLLAELKAENEAILQKMNKLYDDNADNWVDKIVADITE
ncbi:MAG: hypothetical protein MJ168_09575 [Clostridia bacterium]|nr:hypothetical protein [Clostridia bacterium]